MTGDDSSVAHDEGDGHPTDLPSALDSAVRILQVGEGQTRVTRERNGLGCVRFSVIDAKEVHPVVIPAVRVRNERSLTTTWSTPRRPDRHDGHTPRRRPRHGDRRPLTKALQAVIRHGPALCGRPGTFRNRPRRQMRAPRYSGILALMSHARISPAASKHQGGHHRAENLHPPHRRGSRTNVAASSGSVGPSPKDGHHSATGHTPQAGRRE